ncbi:MAG: cytidylate kinase [Planctomycetaceae bacterium]|nr:cytidylate kinase [Planctomycetaceae bacterium]
MIVTIDGPAGSGKSSAARELAERLGFRFLDTGAMYRAVALHCLNLQIAADDEQSVASAATAARIEFVDERLLLDGRDVTAASRTAEVTEAASLVATYPAVRARLVDLQRNVSETANIVTEGRDQGTVVFPDAECKFFLTADARHRAQRRRDEMRARGEEEVSLEEMLETIRQRDERDASRTHSPLRRADDAIEIDTSTLTLDEVIAELESRARDRLALD